MGTATQRRPAANASALRTAVGTNSPAHANKRATTAERTKKAVRVVSAAPPRRSPRRATVVKQVQFGGPASQDEGEEEEEDDEEPNEVEAAQFSGTEQDFEQDESNSDDGDSQISKAVDFNSPVRQRRRARTPIISAGPSRQLSSPHGQQTPPMRSGSAPRQLTYTPYRNPGNAREHSKPLFNKHSPLTQTIVKKAGLNFRANTVAQGRSGFLQGEPRQRMAAEAFVDAARSIGADTRLLRFDEDPVYAENVLKMIFRHAVQLRGDICHTARTMVPQHWNLEDRGPPDVVAAFVRMLLTDYNFIFEQLHGPQLTPLVFQVERRVGPYRPKIFKRILSHELFHEHEQMAVAESTASLFNPLPIPALALVGAAVQCALSDWVSGVRSAVPTPFAADQWATIYDKHCELLEDIRRQSRRDFTAWTRMLYQELRANTTVGNLQNVADIALAAEEMYFGDVPGLEQYYDE